MGANTYGNPPRAISEFPHDPTTGKTLYTDACGPCAYETAAANISGLAPTQSGMTAIRNDMIAHGKFTPGGGCTIADLQWFASTDAVNVTGFHDNETAYQQYQENLPVTELRQWLQQNKGAIIIEIGNAYKLPYNEQGVHYHFVCTLDYDSTTDKALVANGDRVPAGGPDWITLDEIANADIVGMLALNSPTHMGSSGGSNVAVPNGWTDDSATGTLSAPGGKATVHLGFRDYILAHSWDSSDIPQTGEISVSDLLLEDGRWGNGNIQVFTFSVLMAAEKPDPALGVGTSWYITKMPLGIEYELMRTKLAQVSPPPPPPPTPTTPTLTKVEQAALDFAHAIEGH